MTHTTSHIDEIIYKLDLAEYLDRFASFCSRECELAMQGDLGLHLRRIQELANMPLNPPKQSRPTNGYILKLSKHGICHLDELYEFAKMIEYICYLKSLNHDKYMSEFLDKITLEQWVLDFADIFDQNGELKTGVDARLDSLYTALERKNAEISSMLRQWLAKPSLAPYLMDNSLHLQKDCECLLVRPGYASVCDANIIARSSGGGFYIEPKAVSLTRQAISQITTDIETIKLEHAKSHSAQLSKNLAFVKFLDKTYTLLDGYQARAAFARALDLDFVTPSNDGRVELVGFAHPALKRPKLLNVSFDKKALLITGVNAGGKSMLLKSILSASLLCKYLIPMRINAAKSHISTFKQYQIIMQDPQDSSNDISTFAGRMQSFAALLDRQDYIAGIDEIELGTDFEEASSLFYVLIRTMLERGARLIITTHHKRLALMLSKHDDIRMLAALYDEKNSMPKYEFLADSIGKSYAFETARRYGIPASLINAAIQTHGEEKQNLEAMINKSIELDLKLKKELKLLSAQKSRISDLVSDIKEQKSTHAKTYKEQKTALEKEYLNAINEAKKTINLKDTKEKQRQVNKAWELQRQIKTIQEAANEKIFVGDSVRYGNIKGTVISLKKDIAHIQSDFGTLNVSVSMLKRVGDSGRSGSKRGGAFGGAFGRGGISFDGSGFDGGFDAGARGGSFGGNSAKSSANGSGHGGISLDSGARRGGRVSYQRTSVLSSIDLHGLRADDALARLDKFISDALIAGHDEVIIYHGIGTGRLAFVVKEFLASHPSVKGFSDAPPKQGGMGAKIVKL